MMPLDLMDCANSLDPMHEAQLAVTRDVLREIGAEDVPSLLVLNKADRLDASEKEGLLRRHSPFTTGSPTSERISFVR